MTSELMVSSASPAVLSSLLWHSTQNRLTNRPIASRSSGLSGKGDAGTCARAMPDLKKPPTMSRIRIPNRPLVSHRIMSPGSDAVGPRMSSRRAWRVVLEANRPRDSTTTRTFGLHDGNERAFAAPSVGRWTIPTSMCLSATRLVTEDGEDVPARPQRGPGLLRYRDLVVIGVESREAGGEPAVDVDLGGVVVMDQQERELRIDLRQRECTPQPLWRDNRYAGLGRELLSGLANRGVEDQITRPARSFVQLCSAVRFLPSKTQAPK